MQRRSRINIVAGFAVTALGIAWLSGCARSDDLIANTLDSGGMAPLPLLHGGEYLDVQVRVKDDQRRHQFNLILEQRDDWPEEKKNRVRLVAKGWLIGNEPVTPYPVKLRLRIDSLDEGMDIHVDVIASTRSQIYMQRVENGTVLLRAMNIHVGELKRGLYRVRIDNLVAAPTIDFPTFFKFERDNRKY